VQQMIDFCNDFEELVRVLLLSGCHAQVQPLLPRFAFHFALRRSLATVQGESRYASDRHIVSVRNPKINCII
jgi:hypothetical protein